MNWKVVLLVVAVLGMAACARSPQSSVLFYNKYGQAVLGKNKFDLGPHAGLLGVRQYYFPCGSSLLPAKYNAAANAQAKYLKAHPKSVIQLQGFDDSAGSPNYSLVMGQQRASSVDVFLRLHGANANQSYPVSYGAETSGPYTGQVQDKNCRVDLVYLAD